MYFSITSSTEKKIISAGRNENKLFCYYVFPMTAVAEN
jgi:hypothetical protein